MIRRLFLISMALAGIATATVGVRSYSCPMYLGRAIDDSTVPILHFFDGRIRFFWIQFETPVHVRMANWLSPTRSGPGLKICLGPEAATAVNRLTSDSDSCSCVEGDWVVRVGDRQQVGPFGLRLTKSPIRFVRVSVWPAVAVLLAAPVLAVIRGPMTRRRRRRRNQCLPCGFDLTGNESGVCPECGTETAAP